MKMNLNVLDKWIGCEHKGYEIGKLYTNQSVISCVATLDTDVLDSTLKVVNDINICYDIGDHLIYRGRSVKHASYKDLRHCEKLVHDIQAFAIHGVIYAYKKELVMMYVGDVMEVLWPYNDMREKHEPYYIEYYHKFLFDTNVFWLHEGDTKKLKPL